MLIIYEACFWFPIWQLVEKRTETQKFVIPAKAAIQDVDESIAFNSWTPAFAGVTSHIFNSLLEVGGGQ